MHVCMLSCFSPIQLFETLWTRACQAPLSMEFSRKEYCSGLLCPPLGDLPDTGIEPVTLMSPTLARAGSLPLVPPERPKGKYRFIKIYVYNIRMCVCV